MRRFTIVLLALATIATACIATAQAAERKKTADKKPVDRVVAMYFHRTERCPTCIKIGSYTEEAIKKGFAKQIKEGTVEFHLVDFQDKNNATLTKGYKIGEPTLIVINVKQNKVKEYKNLKDIWTKVREKPAFVKYVRANVEAYLK